MKNKVKHLEMIQGIIERMARNSFMLKGWTVTLLAGVFVLAGRHTNLLYFLIAFIPVFVFWFLDSYYLLQERLYRALYDKIRLEDINNIDFSMKATRNEFNLGKHCYCSCFFSKTVLGFYFPLAIICSIVIVIALIK